MGCKGLKMLVPILEQIQEEVEPNVPCYFGLQTVWNLPGGSRGTVCPSVEVKQLVGNNPAASPQLSNEELTGCSPWSCPSAAGRCWAVMGSDRLLSSAIGSGFGRGLTQSRSLVCLTGLCRCFNMGLFVTIHSQTHFWGP